MEQQANVDQQGAARLAADAALPTPPHFDGKSEGSRTFKGNVTVDFKIVVNEKWLQFWREDAKGEHASEFMKSAQARHPENDDAFLEAVLRNGLRVSSRDNLVNLFKVTGLGGTVAPAKVELMAHIPGVEAPVAIQVLHVPPKQDGGHPCAELN